MTRTERAGIYVRISDDPEGHELGVDRQDEDCDALAEAIGAQVVDKYRDNDISASTRSNKPRPEYDRLLADARAGKLDLIIAYTTSRLTRRPREHEDLIDLAVSRKVRYRFVRSPSFDLNSADGRQVARTLAAADAAEAERTAERVARAAVQRARAGQPNGGPRGYGISNDGRGLVEKEADQIRAWYAHVVAGGSVHGLCTDLNRRGVPSATGGTWRSYTVRRILLNPRNAGLRTLGGEKYPTPHPAIVPVETFKAAEAVLTEPDRIANRAGTARVHLGTGLYLCQRCGRTVNSGYDKHRNLLYRCLCCWRSWRADRIDAEIIDAVEGILAREDAAERLLVRTAVPGVDVEALRTEATAIRRNMARFAVDAMYLPDASRNALAEGLAQGEKRLGEINSALAEAGRVNPLTPVVLADDPVAAWRGIRDLARRQALVRVLMTVTLGPPIRGRAKWDPVRVLGSSKWVGDERTWRELWKGADR